MSDDPMERIIADSLDDVGLRYLAGDANPSRLDFLLVDHNINIEVKRFHSERISEQMSRHMNVIAVQGKEAVEFMARLIRAGAVPADPQKLFSSSPLVTEWMDGRPEDMLLYTPKGEK